MEDILKRTPCLGVNILQQLQGVQTLSDKSNFDTMVCKIGQISKVKLSS